jgi:hypothetical protein
MLFSLTHSVSFAFCTDGGISRGFSYGRRAMKRIVERPHITGIKTLSLTEPIVKFNCILTVPIRMSTA